MTKSKRWSKRSDACRIEIGPSRLCAACIAAMGVLGALGWWASDATPAVALVGSTVWLVAGVVMAKHELVRRAGSLVLQSDGTAELDGRAMEHVSVAWRGPFFSLAWCDEGRRRRWLAFPDVLAAPERRELRLWRPAARESGTTAAVAP